MPRGDNPNSKKALIEHRNKFNTETAQKAKQKSDASKKAYASMTEALKSAMDEDTAKELANMLIKRAKQGNLKAWELARDTLGEKPTEKVTVSTVNEEAIERLQTAIKERRRNE